MRSNCCLFIFCLYLLGQSFILWSGLALQQYFCLRLTRAGITGIHENSGHRNCLLVCFPRRVEFFFFNCYCLGGCSYCFETGYHVVYVDLNVSHTPSSAGGGGGVEITASCCNNISPSLCSISFRPQSLG